jgi:hypothetical protein
VCGRGGGRAGVGCVWEGGGGRAGVGSWGDGHAGVMTNGDTVGSSALGAAVYNEPIENLQPDTEVYKVMHGFG